LARPAVTRIRAAALVLLALGVVAVPVAAILATREHAPTGRSLDPGQLFTASATMTPASHLFGASVHLRVDAVVDRKRLDPDRVALVADWRPYQLSAPLVRRRTDVGSIARLRWTGDLHCVIVACAPDPGSAVRTTLEPSYVTYRGRASAGTRPKPIRIGWPELSGFSRLDPIHLQRNAIVTRVGTRLRLSVVLPPWRVDSLPLGTDSYRISPTALFWLALALALGSVVAAYVLLRPWLPRVALGRRQPPATALERALALVESARGRPAEERKALELLAEELRLSGSRGLAGAATELAWSRSAPGAERTSELAANVRRDLEGRRNGDRG
jgi:hypothetical protein